MDPLSVCVESSKTRLSCRECEPETSAPSLAILPIETLENQATRDFPAYHKNRSVSDG